MKNINVYNDEKGNEFGFFAGYATRDVMVTTGSNGVPFATTSIGLDEKALSYQKIECNGFLNIELFGDIAEKFSEKVHKGDNVLVFGSFGMKKYKAKNSNEERESLSINAKYFVVVPKNCNEIFHFPNTLEFTHSYVKDKKQVITKKNAIIMKINKVCEPKQTSVGVVKNYLGKTFGIKDVETNCTLSIFGDKYTFLKEGMTLFVVGNLKTNEWNDNEYYSMTPFSIDVVLWPEKKSSNNMSENVSVGADIEGTSALAHDPVPVAEINLDNYVNLDIDDDEDVPF